MLLRTTSTSRLSGLEPSVESSRELITLREKTERMLEHAVREFVSVDDRYEVPYQSTCVIVHPIAWTKSRTLLRVIAPILIDVDDSSELFKKLSELNNTTIFGKFYARERTIYIEHNLLGESVDTLEFRVVLASIAHHADHLNERLLAEFGGRKWSAHA
jgi:hypothetical protein